MAHSKISVTVPDEVLAEVKRMASERDIKISRLIAEALADRIKKAREESFISKINRVFEDPETLKEQHSMAEDIANYSDIKELKW